VCLVHGQLSLVSTIEELLGRTSCGTGLESREYGCRRSVTLTTWLPLSLEVGTNFADKRRSLGIVRSRTQTTKFFFFFFTYLIRFPIDHSELGR
jgi:hypothetical protein